MAAVGSIVRDSDGRLQAGRLPVSPKQSIALHYHGRTGRSVPILSARKTTRRRHVFRMRKIRKRDTAVAAVPCDSFDSSHRGQHRVYRRDKNEYIINATTRSGTKGSNFSMTDDAG